MIEGQAKFIKYGNAYVYRMPPELVRDSQFPHKVNDVLDIHIDPENKIVMYVKTVESQSPKKQKVKKEVKKKNGK
jgi:hypothetical protein